MPAEVLVSLETGDDAAAYALDERRALVATVDFFTPIVDDPGDWGRIAAANAFSDVYAMGAEPRIALNLVSWPVEELPLELLGEVLRGAGEVAREAGAAIVGGHSITDPEPKFGLVAMGFADRDRLVRNSTAPPGARLFLTKPLGTGIVSTAIKRGRASEEQVRAAVATMVALNADPARAMVAAGAEAATDVTGFGLLGHLHGMLAASGVAARVDAGAVPLLPGVLDLARAAVVPSGTRRNHAHLAEHVDWGKLTEPEQLVLADAQTSGGLLVAARDADRLRGELEARGLTWAEIGETLEGTPGRIAVHGRVREEPGTPPG
jgi:selenide,water dikinase